MVLFFSVIDASGKFPAGINSGNIVELGAFDQCIGIKERQIDSTETIKGKYCIMKIAFPNETQSSFSLNDFFSDVHPYANKFIMEPEERGMVSAMTPNETAGLLIGWCLPNTCDMKKIENIFKLIGMEVKPALGGMLCQTEDDVVKKLDESDWGVMYV